ncbi:hypothetical protein LTR10_018609 [Elasticomyces elasticus]|uniref:Transcription initiation factor TFIID subunit 10 n=1 Tax=Exophiala sideris TaxID=1016849 RepID=A0ABR0J007_9EURO|nr:hypothetical protein LTR10_018609 [Elasticomyces elasticus]KAK5023248.1 hypothetical protein LTS07_009471 [Exophiala sideris]KAK5028620.1 hypothetical protein LTR13_009072 [Exophiala sideris]KAK5052998.1 hypothetical protein LTR69_009568 [Exophiala sideris]KAK5178738.1 hypothetical protein LTR44_008853 [Eurotiomycetes sp. CCFEE 6388]
MSSPPSMPEPADTTMDIDAEMADTTQDASTTVRNPEASSGTLDNEFTQSETQPAATATTTSGLAHHNRKDVTLREFLSKMDDYAPIIPDAVTAHYLTLSGLPPPSPADPTGASTNSTPLPLARLLALATQKFVADVAADAYQYSRIRASNSAAANNPLGNAAAVGAGAGPGGFAGAGAGAAGGAGAGKLQQTTQLGVQRSGYGGGGQGGSGQARAVLTMEDLGMAVQEYGVNIKRGEFYR